MALEPAMDEAEADARRVADPRDAQALAAKGDHLFARSDMRAAGAFYGAALQMAQASAELTTGETERIAQTMQRIEQGYVRHIVASLEAAGFPQSEWHPRFAKSLAIMTGQRQRDPVSGQFPQMPTAFFYPDMPHIEFADIRDWHWRIEVEGASAAICEEAAALLATDGTFGPYVKRNEERPQGDVHGMLDNNDWSSFNLTRNGSPVKERIAHCPTSWATLSGHAPLCTIANRAPTPMFSLLGAGKRIPPHTGMINTRLICHLPLIVPGEGALRVGHTPRQWVQGEMFAFDDSVEHEAWNNAAQDRIVLIFDVWRPELEPAERNQIDALFAAVDSY